MIIGVRASTPPDRWPPPLHAWLHEHGWSTHPDLLYANPRLRIVGVVVNAPEERTRRQRHWMHELVNNAPAPVWQPPVPTATWVGEAIKAGVGLGEWDSPAASVLAGTDDHYLTQRLEAA